MTEIEQEHYTRAVTRMGDRRQVVASQSIYSENNIKLVEQGSRIDSSLYEHLIRHKLLRPLDESLSVDELVDHASLIGLVQQLIRGDEALQQFEITQPLKYRLGNIINRIPLPAPIAFKLTVAREEQPELLTHSLISLIIAIYIASQAGLSQDETVIAASAALFHDIGLLHIDPALLASGHHLSEAERKHLYAHPVIGHLLLSRFSEYPKAVSTAIYEHHERNDGSGYPRGLTRDQLSLTGRILALAEIISSRFDAEGHCQACQQLDFILKMNTSRVDPELVALFNPLLNSFRELNASNDNMNASVEQISACLDKLLGLVERWRALSEKLDGYAESSMEGFINAQLHALSTTLSYAGLNLENLEELLKQCADDPAILQEFLSALLEVRWQLKGLRNELARRWPEQLASVADEDLKGWLEKLRAI